jgi:hypothetical protein
VCYAPSEAPTSLIPSPIKKKGSVPGALSASRFPAATGKLIYEPYRGAQPRAFTHACAAPTPPSTVRIMTAGPFSRLPPYHMLIRSRGARDFYGRGRGSRSGPSLTLGRSKGRGSLALMSRGRAFLLRPRANPPQEDELAAAVVALRQEGSAVTWRLRLRGLRKRMTAAFRSADDVVRDRAGNPRKKRFPRELALRFDPTASTRAVPPRNAPARDKREHAEGEERSGSRFGEQRYTCPSVIFSIGRYIGFRCR